MRKQSQLLLQVGMYVYLYMGMNMCLANTECSGSFGMPRMEAGD